MGYLLILAVGAAIGLAVWDIECRRSSDFRVRIEHNRGTGLYKDPEFKEQIRLLVRVRRIGIGLLVALGLLPLFIKLSDVAAAVVTVIGIILWVVILAAGSKWRRLMKEGIKQE